MNGNEKFRSFYQKAIFRILSSTDWEIVHRIKIAGNKSDLYWVSSYDITCGLC